MQTPTARALALCTMLAAAAGAQPAPAVAPAPSPRIPASGPALAFDFPGLAIGVAEYDEGPTGVTAFYFPDRVLAAVDARGGSPGTVNSDALRQGYSARTMHAIVFAGGSWQGLAAVTGVADEIRAQRATADAPPPIVGTAGAIIFDLGGRRFTTVTPDHALGRAAVRAARPGWFQLGGRGAGRFAMQGWYDGPGNESGQGGAFRQVGSTKIAVFTVVNAIGTVVDREGRVLRCRRAATPEGCGRIADRLAAIHARVAREAADSARAPAPIREEHASPGPDDAPVSPSTTLTLVVTNQRLEWWALQRLATQVHASMGRAIQPMATEDDGDVLFAVSTGAVENPRLGLDDLAAIASEVAWDAVLASAPPADPMPPGAVTLPDAALDALAGEYALGPGATVHVARDGDRLVARSERGGIYLTRAGRALVPVGGDDFVIEGPRNDRLRFDRDASGRVAGLTINPGRRPVAGRRSAPTTSPTPPPPTRRP